MIVEITNNMDIIMFPLADQYLVQLWCIKPTAISSESPAAVAAAKLLQ